MNRILQNILHPVTLIIPCYNEENHIGDCLDSIVNNEYNKDLLEVFVIDGLSTDNTRNIIKEYSDRYDYINLIDNKKKIIPAAMNIGIKRSKNDIIMKIDAHSRYQNNYISKCVYYLFENNVENVGGVVNTISGGNKFFTKSIVKAISHPFGIGNSHFRIGSKSPKFVDTVAYGCYKKSILEKVGLYDENIERSEDIVINYKIKKIGGRILLIPDIVIDYYSRSSYLSFIKHNFDNGIWSILPFYFIKGIPLKWRHIIPLLFVLFLIVGFLLSSISNTYSILFKSIILFYLTINIYYGITLFIKEKNIYYLFVMPISFISLHLSYGLGSLFGLVKMLKLFSKNQRFIG